MIRFKDFCNQIRSGSTRIKLFDDLNVCVDQRSGPGCFYYVLYLFRGDLNENYFDVTYNYLDSDIYISDDNFADEDFLRRVYNSFTGDTHEWDCLFN